MEAIIPFIEQYGYIAVFLATFFEGEIALLACAFLASLGFMNIWLVVIIAYLGAIISDTAIFTFGRHGGLRVLNRYGKYFFLGDDKRSKVMHYVRTHGEKTVFFSRFLWGTRILSSLMAGAFGMTYKVFVKRNWSACVIWTFMVCGLGYFFGSSWQLITKFMRNSSFAVFFILFAVLVIKWIIVKRINPAIQKELE